MDILALYNGLKFAKDTLQVALNYKIENETIHFLTTASSLNVAAISASVRSKTVSRC